MLKSIAKRLIRDEHWRFMSWYRGHFGFWRAIGAYLSLRSEGVGRAPSGRSGETVTLRPGTVDQEVFDQIFIDGDYALDVGRPRFIVDAGAHIGLASVFLAGRYPDAVIVAVEPEASNFELLRLNARAHGNIKPIRAGLWRGPAQLRIDNPEASTWAFRVVECAPGTEGIPALGIADILRDFGVNHIDLLKIDIEGSEVEVMGSSANWIDHVGTLIIELHDRFRPGCSAALQESLIRFDYTRSVSGENVVITDLRPSAATEARIAER